MDLRIFRYALLLISLPLAIHAQTISEKPRKARFFGIAIGADFVGAGMKLAGCDWSQMEVMGRLAFKDKYFPIFEMGIGEAEHEGRELDNRFKTRAPYFRVGMDYNFTNSHRGNRFFAGLRYGFTAFNYDITSDTDLSDPVWKTSRPVSYTGLDGRAGWVETVFGVETRIWTIVRMGWDMRFKFRLHQHTDDIGAPWFVPGYGKNASASTWGGTFKIIFDI